MQQVEAARTSGYSEREERHKRRDAEAAQQDSRDDGRNQDESRTDFDQQRGIML
jgi:hypothetical protein